MPLRRLAVLSVHTSPLAQPGAGDGGGMNVYVRALASALARAGVECDVLTRRDHPGQPDVVEIEPGFRVVHLDAGPPVAMPKHALIDLIEPLADATLEHLAQEDLRYDVLHANYWVSGALGHRLKHELDVPLVATFHTLARVKADAGVDDDPEQRARVEQETISCTDLILASTADEREQLVGLYGADRDRIEIVPPGVDHEIFNPGGPGAREAARAALDLEDRPALLFVGRIQPLKGARLAVKTLAALEDPRAVLLVVGGPSGAGRHRGAGGAARPGPLPGRLRPGPLRPSAAARAPGHLLPGGGRLPGPEPHGVLRARRARGRRVRHAGRRRRRRRPALARRRRQHRVPHRRPGPGRLRGPGVDAPVGCGSRGAR